MNTSEIIKTRTDYFVAMEYYGMILNRTYLILIAEGHLIGILANGLVSNRVESGDILHDSFNDLYAINGDLSNKDSYLKESKLEKVVNLDVLGDEILKAGRHNFRHRISDLTDIRHDSRKKFGMGHYPHDGRIYMVANGKKREFIVLGNQSGASIVARLTNT